MDISNKYTSEVTLSSTFLGIIDYHCLSLDRDGCVQVVGGNDPINNAKTIAGFSQISFPFPGSVKAMLYF